MLNNFYDKFIFTNGLKYTHNNFFLVNLPFLICPSEILAGLLETNDLDFQKKLYSSIKQSVTANFAPPIGTEFGFKGEKLIIFLEQYFIASGWGLIQNVDLDMTAKKAIVKVANNPFAKMLHNKPSMPVDHIIRGIIAGIFSYVFRESVDCVETHCFALGEADCEFIVKKHYEFDISDKRVQQQLELDI